MEVICSDGQLVETQMYIADLAAIDNTLHPYDWYKQYVVSGAEENDLPGDCRATLENWQATEDMDKKKKA
ncbi:MAG: hypothetical protein K2X48_11820 [Chitinophagaceae bacterium]|nr:hypothetical protein [Chitinophagaceae bacterium]